MELITHQLVELQKCFQNKFHKDYLREIFLSSKYSIPLYKLVYNDSVITTYWWGWGTLKFVDDIETRMLYEVLYNMPPLYHLDKEEWEKYKDTIVNKEMTKFEKLSDNVQMTQYGEDIKVIANFSDEIYEYENKKIKSKSLLIIDGENIYEYIPKA